MYRIDNRKSSPQKKKKKEFILERIFLSLAFFDAFLVLIGIPGLVFYQKSLSKGENVNPAIDYSYLNSNL